MEGTINKKHAILCARTMIKLYGIKIWVKIIISPKKTSFLGILQKSGFFEGKK